jgi:predicted permease
MKKEVRACWRRVLGFFGRRAGEDFSAELESHLQMHIADNQRAGMSPEEARRSALIKLGGLEQAKQAYRERESLPVLETLWQDVRFGWRMLCKSPGFTIVAVLTLALGIGTNTAIFSFVDALFLKPLAVSNPEELVRVYAKGPSGHYGAGFSYPEFVRMRDHNSSFAALSVETERPQLHLVTGSDSDEIRGEFVSSNYFSLLGIQPHLGRGFLAAEDAVPGRNAVTVISDQLWKARFKQDPAILGREIRINGISFKVIGVAPPGFYGDLKGLPVEVWIPAMMFGAAGYGCYDHSYNCVLFDGMIGRLAPGQSMARAQAASSTMVWSATDWPERPSRRQVVLKSATGESPDDQAEDAAQLHLLISVTASLLLIACANLAGLLLARGVMRRREIAVRLAIGARRSRVVRQLLTESLLLASLGGVVGLGISFEAKQLLAKFYATDSEGFHHLYDLSFDWCVLVYSMAVALITGILFGLVPSLRASRQDLVTELKEGGAVELRTRGWLSHVLVIGQVALSMVLVIAAGLLIRSGIDVQRGTNFDPDHMMVLRLRPELMKYTQPQIDSLVRHVNQRLSVTPGVQSLAFMEGGEGLVWDWRSGRDAQVSLPGQSLMPNASLTVLKQDVAPNFFRTLRVPLLQGREFGEQDHSGSPRVVIVNHALAQRLWPNNAEVASGAGHIVLIHTPPLQAAQPFQVIGVSADIQPGNALHAPEPHLYLSYWQSNATREGDIRLAIRVTEDPALALPAIRRVIQALDPNVPIGEDMPMSEQVNLEYMPVLLAQRVMSFCGVLTLCLSAIGLYSILAFAVRARTREIGIRMALGARRGDVLRLVVGQGTKLAFVGVVTGAIAALISTHLLASLLFGVNTNDPLTYICVTILLFLVAPTACYFPARRAMRVDPVQALRME